MNPDRYNNLSLKYQRSTPSSCTNIGIRKFEFVAKPKFFWGSTDKFLFWTFFFNIFLSDGIYLLYRGSVNKGPKPLYSLMHTFCLVDFGKSRDRRKYPSQTKPNIYRNGFEHRLGRSFFITFDFTLFSAY